MSGCETSAEYTRVVERAVRASLENSRIGINVHDPSSATLGDIPVCPFTQRHVFPQITNIVMTGVDHVSPAAAETETETDGPQQTGRSGGSKKRQRNSRTKSIDLLRIAQCTPGADLNPHRFAAARMTLRANLCGAGERELHTKDYRGTGEGSCRVFLRGLLARESDERESLRRAVGQDGANARRAMKDMASRATGLYFDTGKYVVTGTASEYQALMAIQMIVSSYARSQAAPNIPRPYEPLDSVIWPKCNVENVVASLQLFPPPHSHLDLPKIARTLGSECTYEPDLFPGVIYRPLDPENKLRCFLLFESGQSVLAGSRNEKEVFREYKRFINLIYSIQHGTAS